MSNDFSISYLISDYESTCAKLVSVGHLDNDVVLSKGDGPGQARPFTKYIKKRKCRILS